MSDLLNIETTSHGRVQDPSYIYISNVVKKYSEQIKFRIDEINRFLPGDHLLVKLLQSMHLQRWLNDAQLPETIRDKLPGIATSFRLTYHNSYGELQHGAIIPDTDEAIILTANDTTPVINIIYHNHFNLNWEIGNPNFKDGLAFIEINMLALARLYFEWVNKRNFNAEYDNLYKFLYKRAWYPLITNYLDLAFYNRHIAYAEDIKLPPDVPSREYRIPNIEDRITKHVENLYRINGAKRLNITDFLNQLPRLSGGTMVSMVPEYPQFYTNQSRWFYSLAKLPYIYNALDFTATTGNQAINSRWIGQLNRFVKTFRGAKTIERLPVSQRQRLQYLVDRLDKALSLY